MHMELDGRFGVVTGAAQGLGRESALALAAAGAAVVCVDVNSNGADDTADLVRAAGGKAVALRVDVSKVNDIDAAIQLSRTEFGGFNFIHNNAGIQLEKPLHETSSEEWQRVIDINLTGVFNGCRQAVRAMLETGGGSIVNTASALSLSADPYLSAYTASKHGVLGLTRAIGVDPTYAQAGIRCNCICPGDMSTPMILQYWDSTPDPAAAKAEMEAHYPARRIGNPAEVANAVVFLVSDRSSYFNASHLIVDGGLLAQVY
jgi:NAD(P)-dependent dehydrogenase (short-subunit alcohol dehydrogenase family)